MRYKELIEKTAYEMTVDFLSKEAKEVSRDDDLETRFMRDRLAPELKRGLKSIPGGIPGAVLGTAGAIKGYNGAAALGGLGAVAGIAGTNLYRRHKDMNNLSQKYLGHKATKQDHLVTQGIPVAANVLPGAGPAIANILTTPESRIQQLRRAEVLNNIDK